MRLLAAHIHMLLVNNARHIKSGNRLNELSDAQIFNHLHGEVAELAAAPDDVEEMGDILCVLFHIAERRGWSSAAMEAAAIRKLAMRFEIPESDKSRLSVLERR